MDQRLFLYLASVLPLGIAAQWLAWRFRLPSILLLLGFGFLLGMVFDIDLILAETMYPDGDQAMHHESQAQQILFPFISLAVAVILFEGGLTLRLTELREAGRSVFMLCTVGALITWVLASLAAIYILGFTWQIGVLLGAVLVVTGPTVIAPLLRHVRPNRRVGSVAKWEGIVIDPIGAVLAVLVVTAVIIAPSTEAAVFSVAMAILTTVTVGVILGLLAGWFLVLMMKRFLIPDFLQNVFFLATILGTFGLSNWVQPESGLVTVTVMGIFIANQKAVGVRHVHQFKESLQVLLISTLFIVLASRINMQDLLQLRLRGLLFLAALILVIRPASVFVSTIGSELNLRERIFLSFLAPRGIVAAAVASIFALEVTLHAAHHDNGISAATLANAEQLVPVTFLVIVGTVAIYGLSAGPIARFLNLAAANPQGLLIAGASQWSIAMAKILKSEGIHVIMVDTNYDHTAQARMAGIPSYAASILSEYIQEGVDLAGIGRVLALTPNDEVNALACQEMSHLFGSAEVYQLAPWDVGEGRRASVSDHLHGRLLFSDECTYTYLAGKLARGHQFKKTPITDEFTYENYRELYGAEAIPMFLLKENGELAIFIADETLQPVAGQRLLSLVPPEEQIAPRREKIAAERQAAKEADEARLAAQKAEAEAETESTSKADESPAEDAN